MLSLKFTVRDNLDVLTVQAAYGYCASLVNSQIGQLVTFSAYNRTIQHLTSHDRKVVEQFRNRISHFVHCHAIFRYVYRNLRYYSLESIDFSQVGEYYVDVQDAHI